MNEAKVIRFSAAERFLHLLYFLAFLTLAGTGLVLYLPQLQGYTLAEAGQLSRLIHRLAAVILMAIPILYFLLDRSNFRESLRKILSWNRADWAWFRSAPRFYWTGDRTGIPPQDKFNTGQKLHALIQAVCFAVFVATGLILWIWPQGSPPWLFRLSVILHDLAFLISSSGFLLHVYLAVIHPLTRQHAGAMVDGTIPEIDARELYPLWYKERHKEMERRRAA